MLKLNPDCIRDILMECEDKCAPYKNTVFRFQEQFIRGENKYSWDETIYHLKQCEMNGFFSRISHDFAGAYRVIDITPKAHEFLANIRNDNVWIKTKDIASKVGSFSLDVLKSCASAVISGIIKSRFGI